MFIDYLQNKELNSDSCKRDPNQLDTYAPRIHSTNAFHIPTLSACSL